MIESLQKQVEYIEHKELKEIREDINVLKIGLTENNLLTKQCVESNTNLTNTLNDVRDTMLLMSENMKQNNKNSEQLANNIQSLNDKVQGMDNAFDAKFREVDDKINIVNEKSKVDILTWVKQNWFGVVMGIGVLTYMATQIIK